MARTFEKEAKQLSDIISSLANSSMRLKKEIKRLDKFAQHIGESKPYINWMIQIRDMRNEMSRMLKEMEDHERKLKGAEKPWWHIF